MSLTRGMKQHKFVREGSGWYIDLPEYLEQGGSKGDLAMVAGADTMLDAIAGEDDSVTLLLDTQPFPGADELSLTQVCEPAMGGGYYLLKEFEGKVISHNMWLCDVTTFVFGTLPPKIFIKRVA